MRRITLQSVNNLWITIAFAYIITCHYYFSVFNILVDVTKVLFAFAMLVVLIFLANKCVPKNLINAFDCIWLCLILFTLLAGEYFDLISFVISFVLMKSLQIGSLKQIEIVKKLLVVGCAYYAVGVVAQKVFPTGFQKTVLSMFSDSYYYQVIKSKSVAGFSTQVAITGGYLVFGLPWLMFREKKSFLCRIGIILVIAALIIIGKRASLGFAVIAYIFTKSVEKKGLNNRAIYLLAASVMGILMLLFLSLVLESDDSTTIGRMIGSIQDMFNGQDISNNRLKIYYGSAVKMFLNKPFFGFGWGSYGAYTGRTVYGVYQDAHNCYLQLLAENGIFGFVLVASMFVFNLKQAAQALKTIADARSACFAKAALFIQVFFLLYCFTGNPLYSQQYFFVYAAMCGISAQLYRASNSIANASLRAE